MFKKQEKQRITYSSEGNNTQIDYLICSNEIRRMIKDCIYKVILGESVVSEHRLLVADINIKNLSLKPVEKIKGINLDGEGGGFFLDKLKDWLQDCIDTANELWHAFKDNCLSKVRKHLDESKSPLKIKKRSWRWTEETRKRKAIATIYKESGFQEIDPL